MSRIRTVKPELFKHEALFDAEMLHQLPLRLAFIGLFTCCDREGRFRWQPRRLKIDILPYDEVDFSQVLDALAASGFIVRYEHQGKLYGCIPSWSRHQVINSEIESEIPALEDSRIESENLNKNASLCNPVAVHSVPETLQEILPLNKESTIEDSAVAFLPTLVEPKLSNTIRGSQDLAEGHMKPNRDQERRRNEPLVVSGARTFPNSSAIWEIFEHWKSIMRHPNAQLDDKRKALISRALKLGYDVSVLCQAITGCSYTPYNMGNNDRGQRYDGLHVILGDADQIDRFLHNYDHPPRKMTAAELQTEANKDSLQQWVEQKLKEEQCYANG